MCGWVHGCMELHATYCWLHDYSAELLAACGLGNSCIELLAMYCRVNDDCIQFVTCEGGTIVPPGLFPGCSLCVP
jgi:hypothetical protein